RYWIDAAEPAAAAGGLAAGRRPEQWLFGPSWKRSRLPRPGTPRQPGDGGPWLLFADPSGLADVMAERLRAQGAAVTVVQPGESFARTGEGSYALRPGEDRDYDALCGELAELPAVVFHFWSMSAPIVDPADPAYFAACQALGPYSLLRLARSLERRRPEEPIRIWAVSDGLVEVTGEEPCAPEQAPLVAACRAVSEQYRNLVCRHLDLFIRPRTNGRAGRLIELALAEFRADASELTVAYRGNHRWVPVVEALGLAENASDDRSVEPAGGTFLLTAALEEPGFSVAGALSYLGMSRGGETRLVAIEPRELPPREAWDEWLREDQTPSGEQLAVFLGELADGISLPVEITAEGRDIPALARSAEDELGLETLPEDFDQAVDALCAAYIYRLFSGQVDTAPGTSYPRDELRRKMGVVTHFERFFDYLLQALADDGLVELSAEIVTFRAAAADVADPEQLRESLERRYPSFKPGLECLDHCAGHYQEAFSGATDPVRILYPGGSFEMLKAVMDTQVRYSSTRIYQQVMTELIRDLAERTPERTLRILEVGAGDGNLTWDLVASLDGLNVEYHFTDIGRSFVLNAQKRAAERGLDCMRFGVLDVSQNPAEQGFERYGFDVVVALDVVHATERIRESLMNLQRLLVPGGVMLLLEAARDQRWVTMIWGLAEGWWLFSDLDLRPSSPLLDPEGWESVLEGLGFSSSAAFPQQPEVRATADHALLVARQPAELRSPDYLEWATGRWQERRRRTAERIRKARELESMGAEVMLVAADLADSEQVSAAVRRGEQRLGPISGVVHSSGPEAGDESDPRAWATHFASGAGAVRSLETALAGRSPDFALLVSSLAAAAGQPGSAAAAGMDSFFTARAASYNHRSIDRARTTAPTPVPVSVRIQLRPEKNHRDDTLAWRSVVWGLQGQGSEPGRPSDSPRRGAAVLAHLLAHDELPRVIVARRPPPGMAEAWNRVPEVREAAEAAVGAEGAELVGEHVAPRTDDELTVAGIWQEVLGVEGVGVHDHFFDLGGDSLVATQLNTRLYNSFGLRIPVEKLFEQPTIEGQARTIARVRAEREEQRQSKVLAMLAEMSDEDAEALLRERTV
ncbi:MAG: KR domain-containing protein, partial [bacterium]|nr:KR domain-containing protein [bacterium]